MNDSLKMVLSLIVCLILTACSGEDSSNSSDAKNDHVWKEQTDTIDKAREVEGKLMDSAEETRKLIEQQGQ